MYFGGELVSGWLGRWLGAYVSVFVVRGSLFRLARRAGRRASAANYVYICFLIRVPRTHMYGESPPASSLYFPCALCCLLLVIVSIVYNCILILSCLIVLVPIPILYYILVVI